MRNADFYVFAAPHATSGRSGDMATAFTEILKKRDFGPQRYNGQYEIDLLAVDPSYFTDDTLRTVGLYVKASNELSQKTASRTLR